MGTLAKDLTGLHFGRYFVLGRAKHPSSKTRAAYWLCVCECGNERIVLGNYLRTKVASSCGCFARDKSLNNKYGFKHGHAGKNTSPTYTSWESMKSRCLCLNNTKYSIYGGRGIKICPRWIKSFKNFLEDMGPRPKGKTLDRINNNGNYEKQNCRWATISEQNYNKRPSRKKKNNSL